MILLMESDIEAERFILATQTLTYKELFLELAEALNAEPPRYYANKNLTNLTWRVLWLKSLVTGKPPKFTRHTHRNAHLKDAFTGEKLERALNFKYTPISETIGFVAEKYLKDHGQN
jgi:dihydroflavonol-4-reductase